MNIQNKKTKRGSESDALFTWKVPSVASIFLRLSSPSTLRQEESTVNSKEGGKELGAIRTVGFM